LNSSLNITSLNSDFKKSNKSDKTERYKLFDGSVTVAAIINLELLEVDKVLKVYAFNHSRHILIDSMILNNKAIINFVNDKIKLELRSFIKAISLRASIKYNTLRLLIINYKTRVFKGIFN